MFSLKMTCALVIVKKLLNFDFLQEVAKHMNFVHLSPKFTVCQSLCAMHETNLSRIIKKAKFM